MNLFLQLLGNGIVQGAVAMLYAAGFGFVYRSLMLSASFAAAIECAVYHPENFPNVSDYRNPIIAEAMKVLGYVNCYNRGICTVQDELVANGNGKAEFSFRLITAFEAKVAKATLDESQGLLPATQENGMKDGAKHALPEKLGEKRLQIIELMTEDVKISIPELAKKIGISHTAIENNLRWLKSNNIIRRIVSAKGGHWEVVDVNPENQESNKSPRKEASYETTAV